MSDRITPEQRPEYARDMKRHVDALAISVRSFLAQLCGEHHIEASVESNEEDHARFFEVFNEAPYLMVCVQWTGFHDSGLMAPLQVTTHLTDEARNPIGKDTSIIYPTPDQWQALIIASVIARNLRA